MLQLITLFLCLLDLEQLQKEHAFELSDASDCEQETTIGVILTGNRVKFVIPGINLLLFA